MTIQLKDQQKALPVPAKALETLVKGIFEDLKLTGAEVSIVLCDNEYIAELNRQYLDREGPTNVISFPLDEPEDERENGEGLVLGDIVINTDRAISDAEEVDADPLSEVAFLLIHGILHLSGFDHEGDQAHRAPEMEAMEEKLHEKYSARFIEQART